MTNFLYQDLISGEIAVVNLYRRSLAASTTIARGNVCSGKDGRTWLLLSEVDVISAAYINSGGSGIWLRLLLGEKVWFFGDGVTRVSVLDLARLVYYRGKEPRGYEYS